VAERNIEISFENMSGEFCSRDRKVDDAKLRRDESQTEVRVLNTTLLLQSVWKVDERDGWRVSTG